MSIDSKKDVTGADQLNVKKFIEQAGALNNTTKCCATGTCNAVNMALDHSMKVSGAASPDKRSPAVLQQKFGPIS